MEIKALGYVRVAAPNLDEWASFATRETRIYSRGHANRLPSVSVIAR